MVEDDPSKRMTSEELQFLNLDWISIESWEPCKVHEILRNI